MRGLERCSQHEPEASAVNIPLPCVFVCIRTPAQGLVRGPVDWEPVQMASTAVQVDNSTPSIMREGPLTNAMKSAHYEGAETDVQYEAGDGAGIPTT